MRNLQRSGSRRRERRKMVGSTLIVGKLCSFGYESPKSSELWVIEQLEVKSQREIASVQACSYPFTCASHCTCVFFFFIDVVTENLCLWPILYGGGGIISHWKREDLRTWPKSDLPASYSLNFCLHNEEEMVSFSDLKSKWTKKTLNLPPSPSCSVQFLHESHSLHVPNRLLFIRGNVKSSRQSLTFSGKHLGFLCMF